MPSGMTISRFSPSISLMPFIREYMVIEAEQELINSLVPDTFMAMAIRIKGTTGVLSGNDLTQIPSGIISGLSDTTRTVSYAANSANLIIAFKDGGMAAFSPVPAHELFAKSISAGNIFPPAELQILSEKIQDAITHEARIQLLDQFLLNKLKATPSDPMINRAVELIRKHKGIIRVKDLATALHISQDPFEKKFRARIGSSPKKFASITRIRNLINNYASYTSLTDASYDAGFYDQSHFIKEFRQFTGKSPSAFFSAPPAW
ncbi:AraC family transcriptional regulator [Pseudobacter ginsenosidimutans]|uniref:AraC family transcriptional regulator n=2 Tax=Pseudobacter ginsenosidimutans TaxID=661488 RepID=A0A4Q7MTS0_9BACT|nr:AraC family transcriptional regulator [Pseudobacter ginsenosidimutans]QEC40989.1 helix-turn-helix transcriptional regulator [Pseudobacter ginsenosidimutans]RZS72266.1 AraC family transcriptional regulator [Pseudobacter ginsenosidimutans]